MNSEASPQTWFAGKWPWRVFVGAVGVMLGAWLLQEFVREVPFHAARVKAPNPHEFVVWFNEQEQRCTAEEAAEFSKAIGIIYAEIGARNPRFHKVPGSGRAALCDEIDGKVVADVIIRSYKLADEQLLRFISRQQNDVLKILGSTLRDTSVEKQQEAIANARAQIAKNEERIAVLQTIAN
jgi:hypothetical protein